MRQDYQLNVIILEQLRSKIKKINLTETYKKSRTAVGFALAQVLFQQTPKPLINL